MLATLLVIATALTSQALTTDYDTLALVLGKEKLKLHYSSVTTFEGALAGHISFLRSTPSAVRDRISHITCVGYFYAADASSALMEQFGADSVSPVYTSAGNDLGCFLVLASYSTLSSSQKHLSGIPFKLWTPLPNTLKIHESAMHHLGIVRNNLHAVDVANVQLVITLQSADAREGFAKDFGIKLRSVHPGIHAEGLAGKSPHFTAWKEAADELLTHPHSSATDLVGEDVCRFSRLKHRAIGPSSIEVGNLHEIRDYSSTPTACFASLLAAAAEQNEVVDIRLRHSMKAFNNYIKGIVQTDTREDSVYPYFEAGLNGTGQVVGVGDTGVDEYS